MWKFVAAGFSVLCLMATTFVWAQQIVPAVGQQPPTAARPAPRLTAEDEAVFSDARIAALKAGLTLKPEQESKWAPVEAALRDLAKQGIASANLLVIPDSGPPPDPLDLLRRRSDAMMTSATGLKRLADAAEPLFKTLDDNQKRRLLMLVGVVRPQR